MHKSSQKITSRFSKIEKVDLASLETRANTSLLEKNPARWLARYCPVTVIDYAIALHSRTTQEQYHASFPYSSLLWLLPPLQRATRALPTV